MRFRRMAHATSRVDTWGIWLICTVGVCDSNVHFSTIGHGGWGRRRPMHLPRGAVSSHALPNSVFQKTHLSNPRVPPKFLQRTLPFFWKIQALGIDTM